MSGYETTGMARQIDHHVGVGGIQMAEVEDGAAGRALDGYGATVDRADALPAALDRAVDQVAQGRQAVLNVLCGTG